MSIKLWTPSTSKVELAFYIDRSQRAIDKFLYRLKEPLSPEERAVWETEFMQLYEFRPPGSPVEEEPPEEDYGNTSW